MNDFEECELFLRELDNKNCDLTSIEVFDKSRTTKSTLLKLIPDMENAYVIRINDTAILFFEDPDDGYRSYNYSKFIDYKFMNYFPTQKVKLKFSDDGNAFSGIELLKKNKRVLRVGTSDSDDYYPCSIWDYHPEVLGEVK